MEVEERIRERKRGERKKERERERLRELESGQVNLGTKGGEKRERVRECFQWWGKRKISVSYLIFN